MKLKTIFWGLLLITVVLCSFLGIFTYVLILKRLAGEVDYSWLVIHAPAIAGFLILSLSIRPFYLLEKKVREEELSQ